MKKSKKLLIKIGLIFISLCFLCILYSNNTLAENSEKLDLAVNSSIYLSGNLWNKYKNFDYYCVEAGEKFVGGWYSVKEKWIIIDDNITKSYWNGYKIVSEKVTDVNAKAKAYERGYILAQPNDSFNLLGDSSNFGHLINIGIYDVLSYKQNAIWMLEGQSVHTDGYGFWSDKETLKYNSDLFVIKRKGEENNYFYKFTSPTDYIDEDVHKDATGYEFGDGNDYYKLAESLKEDAETFYSNYYKSVTCTSDPNNKIDYTNTDYVSIGTYYINYGDNVKSFSGFTAYEDAEQTKDITDRVSLEWSADGKSIEIRVSKNNMPSSLNNIVLNYERDRLDAKVYILEQGFGYNQNIILGDSKIGTKKCDLKIEINADLIPAVQVQLNKVDIAGDGVEKAKFKIEYSNGLPSSEVYSWVNGTLAFSKVQPTSPDSFTATITETETPEGYKPLAKPIQLKFTFNSSTVNWEVEKIDGPEETTTIGTIQKDSTNTCTVPITVVNKSIIEKLTILKTSSIKALGALEGAEFKLTLSNVANVKSYKIPTTGATQEAPKTIYVTTDSNGNIVLEDIEIADLSEYVVITIEETKAPVGYKKIEGKITLTLKRTGDHYTEFKKELDDTINISKPDHYIPDYKREFSKLIFDGHTLEVDLFNIPIMNLGGIVWYEDEKIGKTPSKSDICDGEEEALSGIKVYLYEGNDKIAETTSSDGTQTATYTNNKGEKITVNLEKGQYMFTDVKPGEYYHIEFEYDGITYEAITNYKNDILYKKNGQSKISTEINGRELKNGTTTISGTESESQSKTNGGYIIDYELEDNEKIPDKAVYSQISKDGKQVFVTAKSWKYLQKIGDWRDTWKDNGEIGEINLDSYAFDINCGLVKKFFDLNLGTDVASAKVQINGQTSTYNYDQILDGMLDDYLEKVYRTTDSIVDYNLYLAHSDYNYRIEDYKVPGTDGSIANNYDSDSDSDYKIDQDKIDSTKGTEDDRKSELQVYVTYKLKINNQSAQHNVTVNKVKYSYDEGYEFVSSDGNVTDNTEKRELLIEDIPLSPFATDYKPEITLTFKVRKNDDGTFVKEPSDTSKYTNKAEIIEYTTAGRLVDADSAPGNTFLGENKATERCEDDTDTANGIVISFKKEAERSISGKVFEDINKNGEQNEGEGNINDVIVQLIELVPIKNNDGVIYQYEYIWQETVAGSNIVKTTATSGGRGETYKFKEEDKNKPGEYKFTERIIPGNYIVRFIYGDGTYFDTNIDGTSAEDTTKNNIIKYNGEDYKSTYATGNYKDKDSGVFGFNKEWYNTTGDLEETYTKAFDNESRRLSVMSYAVDVDGNKGKTLNALDNITDADKQNEIITAYKKLNNLENENITFEDVQKAVLNNTWMCAETLKIKMPVDSTEQKNIDDTTTIDYGSEPFTKNTQFTNVNFGLMERPKTKLVLEKHITGLTIKPVESGVGLIANATANISDILTGDTITLEGQKDELTTIKSSRTERGFWKVETDTTELAQGADAYITYTYVIKNEGDTDYLSNELVDAYEKNQGIVEGITYGSYEEYLTKLATHVKNKIKSKDFTKGEYLSDAYYKYKRPEEIGDNTKKVLASVVQIQETLNPKVKFVNTTTDFNNASQNPEASYYYYNREGQLTDGEKISEIITNKTPTKKLEKGQNDTDKKLVVSVGLSASEIENGGVYDSYIAQITRYTNAAGRRDQSSTPANLSYVHSYDTDITLENNNEDDEFWAETFRITKPTGEDKLTAVQIAIISVSAVVILGVGIILIKKFVLKK